MLFVDSVLSLALEKGGENIECYRWELGNVGDTHQLDHMLHRNERIAYFPWSVTDYSMAMQLASPSLQQTTCDRNAPFFFVILNGKNGSLTIVDRAILPRKLRRGQVALQQTIAFQDEEGNKVQGLILYIGT